MCTAREGRDDMALTPKMFLIVCPLLFLAGFVDSIAGGGGLISLPAYIFAGLPVHLALGTNKLSNSMGTLVATARYALRGYMVREFVLVAVPLGLAGSWAGSNAALATGDTAFQLVMLAALPFIAFFVLNGFTLNRVDYEREDLPDKWSEERKTEFLKNLPANREKAKSLIYAILPLIVTLLISYIELSFFV